MAGSTWEYTDTSEACQLKWARLFAAPMPSYFGRSSGAGFAARPACGARPSSRGRPSQSRPRPRDALATLATQQADQARQSTEAGAGRRPVLARRDEAGRARHPEGRNVAADGEAVDTPGA